MLSLEQELEIIRWRNRKRRATRAIAIVLIGWLAGLIVGGVIAAIGPVILNYNTNAGVSFIASGVSVFVFFALISIVSAWYEFRLSAFDGPYSDRPGYDYYKTRICFQCEREYPANVHRCSFCDLWLDPRLNFKS